MWREEGLARGMEEVAASSLDAQFAQLDSDGASWKWSRASPNLPLAAEFRAPPRDEPDLVAMTPVSCCPSPQVFWLASS